MLARIDLKKIKFDFLGQAEVNWQVASAADLIRYKR